jgi:hypothetical protein
MTPFDDPFDFQPDQGAPGGDPEPAEVVPARPVCRVRGKASRARTRHRGDPPR